MLGKSSDKLPYNIVYVLADDTGSECEVIGHSRLCKVHGHDKSCFIESVVIKKTHRGKGYGGELMEETEEHARRLGFETVYLTTHDKQDFYRHVGFEFCQPVVSLGSASTLLSQEMMDRLFGKMSTSADDLRHTRLNSTENIQPRKTLECLPSATASVPSPPPAPPTVPTPPPPPPSMPMPPPPPAPVAMPTGDMQGSPCCGDIYWMKKSLVAT